MAVGKVDVMVYSIWSANEVGVSIGEIEAGLSIKQAKKLRKELDEAINAVKENS